MTDIFHAGENVSQRQKKKKFQQLTFFLARCIPSLNWNRQKGFWLTHFLANHYMRKDQNPFSTAQWSKGLPLLAACLEIPKNLLISGSGWHYQWAAPGPGLALGLRASGGCTTLVTAHLWWKQSEKSGPRAHCSSPSIFPRRFLRVQAPVQPLPVKELVEMIPITQNSEWDTDKDIWNVALVHLLVVHTGFSPLIPENYIKSR